ncbi:MAG: phosphatase PAP2 family protein [Acidobacteriota bacterium]
MNPASLEDAMADSGSSPARLLVVILCLALPFSPAVSASPVVPGRPRRGKESGLKTGPDLGAFPAESVPPEPAAADAHVIRRTGEDIKAGFTSLFHRRGHHWRRFLIALAAIGAAGALDHEVRSAAQRNRNTTTDGLADDIRPFGSFVPLAGFATVWLVGHVRHRDDLISLGVDGLESSIIAGGLVTPALKQAVGRARPAQNKGSSSFSPFSGNSSFPAGEPTEAFTAAAVVSSHLDNRYVQAGAWSVAGLVGLERINFDRHFLSDVTAAAFIGVAVNRFVIRRRRLERGDTAYPALASRRREVRVAPVFGGGRRGALLRIRF